MRTVVDLLIHGADQVCTVAGGGRPKRGPEMGDVGLLLDGAVAVDGGRIVEVGPSERLRARYRGVEEVDARGRILIPGLVDAHTHALFAGERAHEFELRLRGVPYLEIQAQGGGILATTRAVRTAGVEGLVAETAPRLRRLLAVGTTTAEVKTGYALTPEGELAMLDAIVRLDRALPLRLVPTFLGAHAVPPEYADDPDAYLEALRPILPEARRRGARFCDIFCETGVFSADQARRHLSAAREAGLIPKLHADEFAAIGGLEVALELEARSVDHLEVTSVEALERLAASWVAAVALPLTSLGLPGHPYMQARPFLEAGGILALGSDLNPGPAWCESMLTTIAIACRGLRITPAEALTAATLNAAYAVGMEGEVGSLEPGKAADLVLLDLPDYRHLGYRMGGNPVAAVYVEGRRVV